MEGKSKKELADIAGYTYRRLHDIDKVLPESEKLFTKGSDGKYDLPEFVQRWVQYNVNKEAGKDGNDLNAVKAQHEVVKMQKSELELERMRGETVRVDELHTIWSEIVTAVRQKFMHIPGKIAPSLVMLESRKSIESIIDKEICDALTMISDTPLPSISAEKAEASIDADELLFD